MEKKTGNFGEFSPENARRAAQSAAGQQLLQQLQSSRDPALQDALSQASAGNMAAAKQALQALLQDEKTRQLLQRLQEDIHG